MPPKRKPALPLREISNPAHYLVAEHFATFKSQHFSALSTVFATATFGALATPQYPKGRGGQHRVGIVKTGLIVKQRGVGETAVPTRTTSSTSQASRFAIQVGSFLDFTAEHGDAIGDVIRLSGEQTTFLAKLAVQLDSQVPEQA